MQSSSWSPSTAWGTPDQGGEAEVSVLVLWSSPRNPRTWGGVGQAPRCCCRDQQPLGPQSQFGPPLLPPYPLPRSELIQLVAVTQKTAERSYREHIEQQIQTYQRRWAPTASSPSPPHSYPSLTLPA